VRSWRGWLPRGRGWERQLARIDGHCPITALCRRALALALALALAFSAIATGAMNREAVRKAAAAIWPSCARTTGLGVGLPTCCCARTVTALLLLLARAHTEFIAAG